MAIIERLIRRANGAEVKIVAQEFFGAGLARSVGVHVLHRESPESNWKLCGDRPHPNWETMSVEEYSKNGRSEMLQKVSPGEILSVVCMLEKSANTLHQERRHD